MIDVSNRVFSNVRYYVKQRYPKVNFQNATSVTPPDVPACSVIQIDNSEVALDLGGGDPDEDFSVDSNIEIQVYSNVSDSEAKNIMTAACNAMRGMAYARTYGITFIRDRNVPNAYRCVARFRRIVSSLDEIPKFTGGN